MSRQQQNNDGKAENYQGPWGGTEVENVVVLYAIRPNTKPVTVLIE